jgi:hypothetical protein
VAKFWQWLFVALFSNCPILICNIASASCRQFNLQAPSLQPEEAF